jgi:hypothetical protein
MTRFSVTEQAIEVFFAIRQQRPARGSQKKILKVILNERLVAFSLNSKMSPEICIHGRRLAAKSFSVLCRCCERFSVPWSTAEPTSQGGRTCGSRPCQRYTVVLKLFVIILIGLMLIVRLVMDFRGTIGWPTSLQWTSTDAFNKSATLGYAEDVETVKAIVKDVMPAKLDLLPPITRYESGRKSEIKLFKQHISLCALKELTSRDFTQCTLCQSHVSVAAGERKTCPICESSTVTGSRSQDE